MRRQCAFDGNGDTIAYQVEYSHDLLALQNWQRQYTSLSFHIEEPVIMRNVVAEDNFSEPCCVQYDLFLGLIFDL